MNQHKQNAQHLLERPVPSESLASATRAVAEALLYIGDTLSNLVRNKGLDSMLAIVNGTAFPSMLPSDQKYITNSIMEKIAQWDKEDEEDLHSSA